MNWSVDPLIHNLGTRWNWSASRPCCFNPGVIDLDAHWIGCWMGPRPVWTFWSRDKSFLLSGTNHNSFAVLPITWPLHWLLYLSSHGMYVDCNDTFLQLCIFRSGYNNKDGLHFFAIVLRYPKKECCITTRKKITYDRITRTFFLRSYEKKKCLVLKLNIFLHTEMCYTVRDCCGGVLL